MKYDSFLEVPYMDRQFIAFVDDFDYEIGKRQVEKEKTNKTDVAIGAIATAAAFAIPGGMLSKIGSATIAYGAKEIFERYSKIAQNGVPVKTVPYSVSSELSLPLGHPRTNVLYVAHPAIPKMYIPAFDFHKTIFESRTCELISILMHLGATEIEISHEIDSNNNVQASSDLSTSIKPVISAGVGTNKTKNANKKTGLCT